MKKSFVSMLLLIFAIFQGFGQNKTIRYLCDPATQYAVPAHFTLGSMGGFLTYSEAVSQLDSMRAAYPNLISQKHQIGTSIEGRAIYQVRISSNPDTLETEPQILFTSLHHSQEPASLQQLIMYMWFLLENYSVNTEVQYLVNSLDINFVPVVNPDGYVYNETQNPNGGGTWRKNRRQVGLFYGVDLNRNYDYAFGYDEIGSSSIPVHPWYRGDSAFSEPESRAMRDFIEANNFKLAMNWHSYGNFLIYPWNYETLLTNDSVLFEQYSRYMTLQSHYRYGTCDQTYGYNSNGDADDWAYGNLTNKGKIISFTAEIGSSSDGFWPAQADITELCRQSLDMNLRFTRLAAKFAVVNDIGTTYTGDIQGEIPLEVYCLGQQAPAAFIVSMTGLSPWILSTGGPFISGNINPLDEYTDSIAFTLSASTPPGTTLKFLLNVSNGIYTWSDTLVRIFAPVDTLFADSANAFALWDNSGWYLTTSDYVSSPSCFSDSPGGNYSILQSADMEMLNSVSLSGYTSARLQFKAKWNMEIAYDWMEVYASANNGSTWEPLCGRYSSYGSDDQNETEPVYDGFYNDWLLEEIPLDAYLGGPLKIRFTFNSDQTHNFDGAYLDDIYILATQLPTDIHEHFAHHDSFCIYPNPASDKLFIQSDPDIFANVEVSLQNILGQEMAHETFSGLYSGKTQLDISDMPPGCYFVKIKSLKHDWVFKLMIVE